MTTSSPDAMKGYAQGSHYAHNFMIYTCLRVLCVVACIVGWLLIQGPSRWLLILAGAILLYELIRALWQEGGMGATFEADDAGIRVRGFLPRFCHTLRWEDLTSIRERRLDYDTIRYGQEGKNPTVFYWLQAGDTANSPSLYKATALKGVIVLRKTPEVRALLLTHRPDLIDLAEEIKEYSF